MTIRPIFIAIGLLLVVAFSCSKAEAQYYEPPAANGVALYGTYTSPVPHQQPAYCGVSIYRKFAYTPRVRYAPWMRATVVRHRYTPVYGVQPYMVTPIYPKRP